jgi:hypothetical protein
VSNLAPLRTTKLANSKKDELRLLINSRHPILTVETTEEERFEAFLADVAATLGVPLFTWTVTAGLARFRGAPIYHTEDPEAALSNSALIAGDGIFLLKDFARYCENDRVSRRLREVSEKFRTERRSIVITAPAVTLPAELEGEAMTFVFGLPSQEELQSAIRKVLADGAQPVTDAEILAQAAQHLSGLCMAEAIRTLRMCLLARPKMDAEFLDQLLEMKRQAVKSEGVLELLRRDASFTGIRGLKRLREWVAKRKGAFTPEGQRFGLVPPKGVLITGVQGCGKSLAARAIAMEWGYELGRFDAGSLYDKYVGESEKRLRKALELAHRLAPIVLWIDEIEKAFASAGASGDADAGLSQRLVATLLTWMQDREAGVFLAATSNNISALPPEMLRKGRFDEIFFVDLPDDPVRVALFALHLEKRGRDSRAFDLGKLARASEGFSGAEIEQAIVSALYTAFNVSQDLNTEILLGELAATQPLSVTRAEEVSTLREWARTRTVPAD